MYSAIKKDGRKLYELARRGEEVARVARDIHIYELELLDEQGTKKYFDNFSSMDNRSFFLRVVCSKGTYIRTLCHDIGAALGCGGTLSALRRIRAGSYTIDMAYTLDDVLSTVLSDSVNSVLLPVDSMFTGYPSIYIDKQEVRKAKNGNYCRTGEDIESGIYRVYAPDGEFLLLGEVVNNTVKAIKSFFEI